MHQRSEKNAVVAQGHRAVGGVSVAFVPSHRESSALGGRPLAAGRWLLAAARDFLLYAVGGLVLDLVAGLLLAALVVFSGVAAWAQKQPQPPKPTVPIQEPRQKPETGPFVFRAETKLVVLHATVLDKTNHFVTNLTESAFKVYENGVEQTLKFVKREDVPVSVGIIVDNSGSMRDKREKVNAAALAFVKASHPQDEVFIVNFNDDAYLDQAFTNKQELLQDALKKIDQRGGTAFYDAVSMSLDYSKQEAKKDKKVILLVTDGEDNASQMTLEKLLRKVQESADTAIFTVGLLNEEERRAARRTKRALSSLAETSGGAAFFPRELAEVDEIAHRIAADIRNQYTLGYTPTNEAQDGSFRQIKVALVGPGRNYTVRTRTGYYARGQSSAQVTPPSSQLR